MARNTGNTLVSLYVKYRSSARHRKHVFDLSFLFFREITQKPCFYCGVLPCRVFNRSQDINRGILYNGIDRLDNDKGYSIDNVVPCCTECNFAKGNMIAAHYTELCQRVTTHQKKDREKEETMLQMISRFDATPNQAAASAVNAYNETMRNSIPKSTVVCVDTVKSSKNCFECIVYYTTPDIMYINNNTGTITTTGVGVFTQEGSTCEKS